MRKVAIIAIALLTASIVAITFAGTEGKMALKVGDEVYACNCGEKCRGKCIPAKDLGDFDIQQAGRMKRLLTVEKPLDYSRPRRRAERHLDQGRGVYNDHLPSLSALTALAGGTLVVTGVRWMRRLLSSSAVGHENGLPASYVMEAVRGPLVIKLDGVEKAGE